MTDGHSYGQKVKLKARRLALKRAVKLVTSHRDACAIVPANHVRDVWRSKGAGSAYDSAAVSAVRKRDIRNWEGYRRDSIGRRKPGEITVAYLAGPEPENDLDELLRLGIRPENIWAFENHPKDAKVGHDRLADRAIRGVKFLQIDIEDFFVGSSRRFDIIYIDACASLPKGSQLLVTLFEQAALAPLGVLVTNFSKPDVTNEVLVERHTHAIAAYLFSKGFLDLKEGGTTDGAAAHSYVMSSAEIMPAEEGDAPQWEDRLFLDVVREEFAHYYGSFVTRHIMDIATLIAPMVRLARTRFWAQLSSASITDAAARGRSMLRWPEDIGEGEGAETGADDDTDTGHGSELAKGGEAIDGDGTHSLLHAFDLCAAYGPLEGQDPLPDGFDSFIATWMKQLRGMVPVKIDGKVDGKITGADLAAAYYGLRADPDLQSETLRRATEYPFRDNMAFLCDVPNSDIGFFPAIAQLAHPSHCNVREVRRYRYTAKTMEMFLDVLPFDECRYVYDWQSVFSLMPGDWADPSDQLIFRFAIDAIAKSSRWYQNDFLHGCHSIGTDYNGFPAAELKRRRALSPKKGKKT
jgi:hypothetical protein